MTTHTHTSWPLFKNDGQASWPMSTLQKEYLSQLTDKLRSHKYTFISNSCLCGAEPGKDILVSQKDRFGLSVNIVMCSHCGLLRNENVFSPESCAQFYQEDYHGLVFGEKTPPRSYFNEQNERGYRFYKLVEAQLGEISPLTAIEISAGCGGVLYPFHRRGCSCIGFEFNEQYMCYGRARGLDLRNVSELASVPDGSVDLVILSHVLEHVSDPSALLLSARRILRADGFLIVEVPGVFDLRNKYDGLLSYLVIAHFFHYTGIHLQQVLGKNKFKVLYCDETVTCLAQKTKEQHHIEIPRNTIDSLMDFLWNSAAVQKFPSFRWRSIKQRGKALLKKCSGVRQLHTALKSLKQSAKQIGLREDLNSCRHKKFILDAIDCTNSEREELERRLRFYVHEDAVLLPDSQSIPHLPRLVFGKNVTQPNSFDIDWRANPSDGWEWCRLTNYAYQYTASISKAQKILNLAIHGFPSFKKAYVFGTGPSLEEAKNYTWEDGYRIVCNTIVKDKGLWNHINPHFIVAADAIYHFGNDDFARAFRQDLQKRLRETDTYFIYPSLFDAIVRLRMDVSPEKLIPVPSEPKVPPHYDLKKKFYFTIMGNVLPIQLTVACSLAKNIQLWGYDGRAPSDKLFWTNSKKQHYTEHVPGLQKNHPMFYKYYVPDGCGIKYVEKNFGSPLENFLEGAEKKGYRFSMLHKSWTEVLEKRRGKK